VERAGCAQSTRHGVATIIAYGIFRVCAIADNLSDIFEGSWKIFREFYS